MKILKENKNNEYNFNFYWLDGNKRIYTAKVNSLQEAWKKVGEFLTSWDSGELSSIELREK